MFGYISICVGYVLVVFNLTSAQRRIINGEPVDDKRYVVYIVRAESSPQKYDAWLCGGAIVSPEYVVTAAACVEDVQFMYVIAGYKKYVQTENLNYDECTKTKKKKVTFVCTPKAYEFSYPDVEKWARIDIAVAKVESPYNFNDKSYLSACSYVPNKIPINYEKIYQEPGVDAFILGWGHPDKWRARDDIKDYNRQELQGTSVRIYNKKDCRAAYAPNYPILQTVIDQYMICTMTTGNINALGELIVRTDVNDLKDGCGENGFLRGSRLCDEYDERVSRQGTERNPEEQQEYGNQNRKAKNLGNMEESLSDEEDTFRGNTRRNGICQNDHGGPLVTWVGAHEVLIGVASVFRINKTSDCVGPFLFTSTWCNSAFLNCIVNEGQTRSGRRVCELPPEKIGYTLMTRNVSWAQHPDGPAENEIMERPTSDLRTIAKKRDTKENENKGRDDLVQMRPQIPLYEPKGTA